MSLITAFAVPISYHVLTEHKKLNEQLVNDSLDAAERFAAPERSGVGVKQTLFGINQHYSSFRALGNVIEKYAKETYNYIGVNEQPGNVLDIWVNVNTSPTAYHMPHSHSTKYILTGVYFPMTLEGRTAGIVSKSQPDRGDLVLLDPQESVKTALATPHTNRYPFFGNPICIAPAAGTLVIFPTYLSHLVTPTETGDLRISIAFNIQ